MDKSTLTAAQRQLRMNIRNFLLVATVTELYAELAISQERGDHFRSECIRELLIEEGE